jgi:hypothetical protein
VACGEQRQWTGTEPMPHAVTKSRRSPVLPGQQPLEFTGNGPDPQVEETCGFWFDGSLDSHWKIDQIFEAAWHVYREDSRLPDDLWRPALLRRDHHKRDGVVAEAQGGRDRLSTQIL